METHQKHYKTFAIGNGMKSICVPDCYSAKLEDDMETLLLYDPETDDVWIRISVMTSASGYSIKPPKEKDRKMETAGDKRYFFELQQYEGAGGHMVVTCFYDIDCHDGKILISVTTLLENSETEKFKSVLAGIPEYIASIKDVSLNRRNFFNLTDDDCRYIRKQSADILGITEDRLNNFHEEGQTFKTIQNLLEKREFSAENMTCLRSLGLVFGDYIRYKYPDFQWTVLYDSYGREYILRYKQTAINIFAATMILKRVQDGEKPDVEKLLNTIVKAVKEAAGTK